MGESFIIKNNARLIAVFLTALLFVLSQPALAAVCSNALTIVQTSSLGMGTLQTPASSATFAVAGNASGSTSGTGTLLYGTTSSASFQLTDKPSLQLGSCDATITISVADISCGLGCLLGSWTGQYNGVALKGSPPWSGLPRPGTGKTLYLGATATYNAFAFPGTRAPWIAVSAGYDGQLASLISAASSLAFDVPLSIDTISDINLGHVAANTAGTYTINTSGTVTTTGSGQWINGTTSAGQLLIHGSATQTISIYAGSYIAGGAGGGVQISNATCAYNGGAPASCALAGQAAPTSAGKILLIGATVNITNQSQAGGSTATPTFTITVTYS
jgi:hypothetical protein